MSLQKLQAAETLDIWYKNVLNTEKYGYPVIRLDKGLGVPSQELCLALGGFVACGIYGIMKIIFEYAGIKQCKIDIPRTGSCFTVNGFIFNDKAYVMQDHTRTRGVLMLELSLHKCTRCSIRSTSNWFRCNNIVLDTFISKPLNQRKCHLSVNSMDKHDCRTCFYCVNDLKNKDTSLNKYYINICMKVHGKPSGKEANDAELAEYLKNTWSEL